MIDKNLAFFTAEMRIKMQVMAEYNKLISDIVNLDRPDNRLEKVEATILCKMLETVRWELTALSLETIKVVEAIKETQPVEKDEVEPF